MILTRAQLEQIYKQALDDRPFETCGVIGGLDGRALKIYPLKNVDENPKIRYSPDKQELFDAVSEIEWKKGWHLLAIYHSHPETRAYPSATDIRESGLYNGTDVVFLIISLMNPDAPEPHAYLLNGETITETTLEILDE